MGLGLLLLRQAMQGALEDRSSFYIRRKFDKAILKIRTARRNSKFLENSINDPNWISKIQLVSIDGFQISPKLLTTGHNLTCAFNAYLAGDFEKEISHLQSLKGVPAEFQKIISGYMYDGHLELADSRSVADGFLDELSRLRIQRPEAWLFHAVYGDHACRWNQSSHDYRQPLEDATRNRARTPVQAIEGGIRKSRCLWSIGRSEEAFRDLVKLFDKIDRSVAEPEEKKRLYVATGLFYARAGRFNRAQEMFRRAGAWPFTLNRVLNEKGINDFKSSDEYQSFQWEVFANRDPLPVEPACAVDAF